MQGRDPCFRPAKFAPQSPGKADRIRRDAGLEPIEVERSGLQTISCVEGVAEVAPVGDFGTKAGGLPFLEEEKEVRSV